MPDHVLIRTDNRGAPGDTLHALWVQGIVETLRQVKSFEGIIIGQQQRQPDFRMALLCTYKSSHGETVKAAILSDNEIRYAIFDDMALDINQQTMVYNVTQQMWRLMDRQHLRYAPALRAELRKLEQYDEDLRFQEKYSITNKGQLQERKADLQFIIDEIVRRREPIYKERRTAAAKANPQRMAELEEELKKYKAALAGLRHELRVATRIEDRLENKLPEMLATREAQERITMETRQSRRTVDIIR